MLEAVLGPRVDDKILQELEANFPMQNPHPKEDITSIMYNAGQRSVLAWLVKRLEE